jgi:hypothetical protein
LFFSCPGSWYCHDATQRCSIKEYVWEWNRVNQLGYVGPSSHKLHCLTPSIPGGFINADPFWDTTVIVISSLKVYACGIVS